MQRRDDLDAVLDAWRLSATLHAIGDPLDENGLLAAEARLGRDLPTDLRRVYEFSDGFDGFDGNIHIERALKAADLAEDLRDSDWDIAPELLVFGGNGSDEHWALWYPDGASPDEPTNVIEIGEIFDSGGLALIGSSLPRFLRMVSAFHLAGRTPRRATRSAFRRPFAATTMGSLRLSPGPIPRCRSQSLTPTFSASPAPTSNGSSRLFRSPDCNDDIQWSAEATR